MQSLFFLNPKYQASSRLYSLGFFTDLVRNPEDRFSHDVAYHSALYFQDIPEYSQNRL